MSELEEAVSEAVERGGESPLNSVIALLVALAATLMALDHIKDGNVLQEMQKAQARTVDTWSYYQAKSTKQNLAEATADTMEMMRAGAPAGAAAGDLEKRIAAYKSRSARYEKEKETIKTEAEGLEAEYERLKQHHDQFDLSDAGFSVAIALFGVTVLTRRRWLLVFAGAFMLMGIVFGLAGFLHWGLHPDRLMSWLG